MFDQNGNLQSVSVLSWVTQPSVPVLMWRVLYRHTETSLVFGASSLSLTELVRPPSHKAPTHTQILTSWYSDRHTKHKYAVCISLSQSVSFPCNQLLCRIVFPLKIREEMVLLSLFICDK